MHFQNIPFARIGIFFATFMHLMHSIVCITHAYHAFRTICRQNFHRSRVKQYCWYRVIIVSSPKVSCNIVWIHKKILLRGGHIRLGHKCGFHPQQGKLIRMLYTNVNIPSQEAEAGEAREAESVTTKKRRLFEEEAGRQGEMTFLSGWHMCGKAREKCATSFTWRLEISLVEGCLWTRPLLLWNWRFFYKVEPHTPIFRDLLDWIHIK